jgi:hypothetical protein
MIHHVSLEQEKRCDEKQIPTNANHQHLCHRTITGRSLNKRTKTAK